jgi:hypothetical protein
MRGREEASDARGGTGRRTLRGESRRTLLRPRLLLLSSLSSLFFLSLFFPGCLLDSREDLRARALRFSALRFPSPIAAADSTTFETGFFVGPNTCWAVEKLEVAREGNTIRVSGLAVERTDGHDCGTTARYATRVLPLPRLDPGIYLLRAGDLQDTLVVSAEPDSSSRRFVARGFLYPNGEECLDLAAPPYRIGLAARPDSIPLGETLVWGMEIDEDPCGRPMPGLCDFFASVRRIAPAPS